MSAGRTSAWRAACVVVAALIMSNPASAQGTDCSQPFGDTSVSPGNIINLTVSAAAMPYAQPAIAYWSACPGYQTEIPQFQIGGSGGVPVYVILNSGNNSTCQSCGCVSRNIVNGHVESATITLWTTQVDGSSCQPIADSLAHELGHILSLADAPDPFGACLGHIMGSRFDGGTRSVAGDDCAVADDMWETSGESSPPKDPYCDAYCWTSCTGSYCPPRPPGSSCPVLIDLDNNGFRLTSLANGVRFDIDSDGLREPIAWTQGGDGDVFLVLDRNANGAIDDGRELFGNFTLMLDGSTAPNGYVALAEYDRVENGGNDDMLLDQRDAVFGSLQVWTDRDHDGQSDGAELRTLIESGVVRIDLVYSRSNRRDEHGNMYRFRSRAWRLNASGKMRVTQTWDVFFVMSE